MLNKIKSFFAHSKLSYSVGLSRLRLLTVAMLCLYYFTGLVEFHDSALSLVFDKAARYMLVAFFASSLIFIILNIKHFHELYLNNKKVLSAIAICVLLFTVFTGEPWLLIPLILYLLYSDGSIRSLAKSLFIFLSIGFVSLVALSFIFTDIGREVVDKSYSVVSVIGTSAHSLGFSNSNQPLMYFFIITINGAFLFTEPWRRRAYSLVMASLATALFFLTLSVTGYLCVLIFLLCYAVSTPRYVSLVSRASILVVILSLAVTPLIATHFGQNNGNAVNEALSVRPYLWNLRISDGAYLNLIGNTDNYIASDEEDKVGYTLDNQYLLLIARYGWLIFVIFAYVYFSGFSRSRHPAVVSGLLAISIYFFSESILYALTVSIIPVAMIALKVADRGEVLELKNKGSYCE